MPRTRNAQFLPHLAGLLAAVAATPGLATAQVFGEPQFYGFTHGYATATGDFDNDGDIDIVTAAPPRRNSFGQLIEDGSYGVYLNNGDGTSYASSVFDDQHGALALRVGDVNGDGNPDVVGTNTIGGMGNLTNIHLGNGDGTFAPVVSYTHSGRVLALGDMDNDGDLDIVIPNGGRVLLNDGSGSFYTNFVGSDVVSGERIALADFDGDSNMDIAVLGSPVSSVYVQLGTGNGNGDPGAPFQVPVGGTYPQDVAAADINADGFVDIVTNNDGGPGLGLVLGLGDGSFEAPRVFQFHPHQYLHSQHIAVADYNSDGYQDVAVKSNIYMNGNTNRDTSILLFNPANTSLEIAQIVEHFGGDGENMAAADLDNDGDIDIVTAAHWVLNESGCTGDFNGDGAVDTLDVLDFLNAWNAGDPRGDFNQDGSFNTLDVLAFLNAWSTGCA